MSKLSLKQVYAAYAPKVLRLLVDDGTMQAVFGAEAFIKINSYNLAQEKDVAFEQAFMPRFMNKLYPTEQKNAQVAAWLLKAYVNHRHNGKPILAEDFYKVAENLKYFDSLKSSGRLKAAGVSGDILSYKSYQAFLEMLKPFQDARDLKKAAEAMRKITPEQKEIITSETTILYDGKEGQIVIPHTPRAAQYWGGQTKWYLAGTGTYKDGRIYADVHFPDYNQKSPILFIIPKGLHDQKIALVDKTLYDAEDDSIDGLPEAHFNLFQAMLASQEKDIAENIKALIKPEELVVLKPEEDEEIKTVTGRPLPLEWREALAMLKTEIRFMFGFSRVDKSLLENEEFMLTAVREDSSALKYAHHKLKNDRAFMLKAIKENAYCLSRATSKIKADREIVLAAVKKHAHSLKDASAKLRADRKIVMAAVTSSGHSLEFAAPALQAKREIVLAAVTANGNALRYAADILKADREVVMTAVQQHGQAIQFAAPELKHDREIALAAIENDGFAYQYLPDKLVDDREIALKAVSKMGYNMRRIPESLEGDREIALAAVRQFGNSLEYLSPALRADREVVMEAMRDAPATFRHADISLRGDRELALMAVPEYPHALYYMSPELRADRELVLMAVKQNGNMIKYADEHLKKDGRFILACARENISCLEYVHLNEAQKTAVKIKLCEDLMVKGQMVQVKNNILRHEKAAWGCVAAQFGDNNNQSAAGIIAEMKKQMTGEMKVFYESLGENKTASDKPLRKKRLVSL